MFGSYNNPLKMLTVSSLYKLARKYGQEALGKQISPHWFRHTYATHIRAKQVDIKAVSMLLRHNSIQTAMNYRSQLSVAAGKLW